MKIHPKFWGEVSRTPCCTLFSLRAAPKFEGENLSPENFKAIGLIGLSHGNSSRWIEQRCKSYLLISRETFVYTVIRVFWADY